MIEKYPHKYCLQDEYGYTDKDLVDKLNEVIEVVNTIAYKNNECSNDCRTANQTNADRIRNMSDEELASWYVIKCEIMMGIKCQKPYKTCKDCIFEWLQSEAE